jgi:hypothetical protein
MRPGNILGSPQSMQSHGGLTMYTTNLDTSLARVMSPSDGLTCSRCSSGVWCLGNIKRRGVQFNVCLAGHRQGTQHTWRQCQDIKWPAHATFVSTATTMNDYCISLVPKTPIPTWANSPRQRKLSLQLFSAAATRSLVLQQNITNYNIQPSINQTPRLVTPRARHVIH